MSRAVYSAKMGGERIEAEIPINESVVTFYKNPGGDDEEKHQLMTSTFNQLYREGEPAPAAPLPTLPPVMPSSIPTARIGQVPGSPVGFLKEAPEWLEDLLEEKISNRLEALIEKVEALTSITREHLQQLAKNSASS